MTGSATFLVFGGTGQTGRHVVSLALADGHAVRVLARTPEKLAITHANLDVRRGSLADVDGLDALLDGVDHVIATLGDAAAQRERMVNLEFVRNLVPAMRRRGVSRFLYQAGGLSRAPGRPQPLALRAIRRTVARGYDGQHRDNEAVMEYLTTEADDVEWMVHRAGIRGDGPSRGTLVRSERRVGIAPFIDCAAYDYRLVQDASAVHTADFSAYERR